MVSIKNDLMTEFVGLSTDTKPEYDGLSNGSSFLEMDTGKTCYWDAEGEAWVPTEE